MLDAESFIEPMKHVSALVRCIAAAILVCATAILTYLLDFWVSNSVFFLGLRSEWEVHALAVLLSMSVLVGCTFAVLVLALSRRSALKVRR